MRKKKIQVQPKSKLGLNQDLKICYNCMFYNDQGICPWSFKDNEYGYYDYNHSCQFRNLFRYKLEYKHYI